MDNTNNTSSYDVKMAQHLRKRDNQEPEGPLLGEVIALDPLSISLYDGAVIVTQGDKCYICSSLINNYTRTASILLQSIGNLGTVTTDGTITYKNIFKNGDKVLCLPSSDGQTFFIVDKVVF